MDRRKALATAGAATATALAATIALGANLGLFGLTSSGAGPGNFEPVGATKTTPRTEVIDVPVEVPVAPPANGAASSSGSARTNEPAPSFGASAPSVAPATAAPAVPQLGEGPEEHEHEAPEIEEPEHEEPDDD